MKETQLKQINKQHEQTKQTQITPVKKEVPIKQVNQPKDIIQSLPTWSIEPPLEIKRGN